MSYCATPLTLSAEGTRMAQSLGTRVRARLPLIARRSWVLDLHGEGATLTIRWMTATRWARVTQEGWNPWRIGFVVVAWRLEA